MSSLDEYVRAWLPRVDGALDGFLAEDGEGPEVLLRAMRHTVLAGGKRVRPLVAILACRAGGGDEAEAMPAAVAVELVHAFSLIHDDLPAMDDDDLRRGRPSCHKAFGEATAILAGDGLLALAFEALSGLARTEAVASAVETLARAVGPGGLVGGQVLDLLGEGREPDLGEVERIHAGKTAALFRAAAALGGLAAGARGEVVDRLSRYGELTGRAFQIADDVLDETGEDGDLGKTAGKDRSAGKMTYPAAAGLEVSRARAEELAALAADAVGDLPAAELLEELASRAVRRTR